MLDATTRRQLQIDDVKNDRPPIMTPEQDRVRSALISAGCTPLFGTWLCYRQNYDTATWNEVLTTPNGQTVRVQYHADGTASF
ncbi:MAG: hypothetical protein ACOY3P_20260 [Planctomycetota bacterium]